jgi:uncharacterized phage protein (TIGR02218 family)
MQTNLLLNPAMYKANLVLFTLADGTQVALTDADQNIKFQPVNYGSPFTYLSFSALLQVGTIKWSIGTEVDTAQLQIWMPQASPLIVEGRAILEALGQGQFDDAQCQIERLFMPTFGDTSAGSVPLFLGNVDDITEIDAAHATLQIADLRKKLNQPFPAGVYQPGCIWPLYSAGCTLVKSSFGVNGTLGAGSGSLLLNTTLTNPDNYFNEGTILFTSGVNAGTEMSVRQSLNASGQVLLSLPLPNPPSTGDAFTAYPGCDKQQSTCQTKFSNLTNFLGAPYVPVPETAA